MFADYRWSNLTHSRLSNDHHELQQHTSTHELAPTCRLSRERTPDYPSPPMSTPPSPTRQPPRTIVPSNSGGQEAPIPTTTAQQPTGTQAFYSQATAPPTTSSTSVSLFPGFGQTSSLPPAQPSTTTAGPVSNPFVAPQYEFAGTSISTVDPSGARGGRKPKAHVASACVNCKRAHLSCDVQRPCARCVASGKQDTCFDVAHKKRGRPRLRDEGEFRFDRTMPPTTAIPAFSGQPTSTPTRPIAATRQRRAESFRSIQSMTSEGSSAYGPPTPGFAPQPQPPPPFQAALTYQQPAPPPGMIPQMPTAFLDLDFKILRVNRSFQQIMSGGRNLSGLRLTEIAASADAETFIDIRNRIRAEREASEPAYLPPILSTGEDPLGGVTEANVDQFTQGFQDRTYTWTQVNAGPAGPQNFPARVRLARAGTYFAVVTLPSFRPMEFPPPMQIPHGQSSSMPFALGPPLHPQEGHHQQQRQAMPASAPPSMYPYESSAPPMQHRNTHQRQSRSYPQMQPSTAFQLPSQQYQPPYQGQTHTQQYPPYQAVAPHRFPVSEPPSQAPSYPRSATQRESGPSTGIGSQLPPPGASPQVSTAAGPSSSSLLDTPGAQRSSSSEGSQGRRVRSPKKRRRMGIDEVLQ